MIGNWLRRFRNRRKDTRRVTLNLAVCAIDSEGRPCRVVSEDVSDRGIRLHLKETNLASFIGQRELVFLEICLLDDAPPVKAQARLVWSYTTFAGGTVSGWQFVHFRGNARRRLRRYLDQHVSEADPAQEGKGC